MADDIKLGTTPIDNLKFGTSQIDKVYQGSSEIWNNNVLFFDNFNDLTSGEWYEHQNIERCTIESFGGETVLRLMPITGGSTSVGIKSNYLADRGGMPSRILFEYRFYMPTSAVTGWGGEGFKPYVNWSTNLRLQVYQTFAETTSQLRCYNSSGGQVLQSGAWLHGWHKHAWDINFSTQKTTLWIDDILKNSNISIKTGTGFGSEDLRITWRPTYAYEPLYVDWMKVTDLT